VIAEADTLGDRRERLAQRFFSDAVFLTKNGKLRSALSVKPHKRYNLSTAAITAFRTLIRAK